MGHVIDYGEDWQFVDDHKECAELIVRAVNAHDQLVAACEVMIAIAIRPDKKRRVCRFCGTDLDLEIEGGKGHQPDCEMLIIESALAAAKETPDGSE